MYTILVLAFSVLLTSFVALTYYFYENEIREDLEHNSAEVHHALDLSLYRKSQSLLALLSVLKDQESLVGAMRVRDREALLQLGTPILADLRKRESITHLYFHAPDGTNFLRIHEPSHFGDQINRHTMRDATSTGQPSVGNEQGPFGTLTLRAVIPWMNDGDLVGYLELGVEFEDIVAELVSTLDANAIVAVDKSLLKRDYWISTAQKKLGKSNNALSISSWDEFPEVVIVHNSAGILPEEIKHRLAQTNVSAQSDALLHLPDDRHVLMVRAPITDIRGNQAASLLLLRDMTTEVIHARQHLMVIAGTSAAICGLLLIGFCFVFERKQRAMEQQAAELSKAYQELQESTAEREKLHERLLVISRQAGMAEVATGVLHNVGNVLNSVNVSANVIAERLRNSEVASFVQAGELIREHQSDLTSFLTNDERGRLLPEFLIELASCLNDEHQQMQREIDALGQGVSHIRHIITLQQSHARRRAVIETIKPTNVMETALEMQKDALLNNAVEIERQYELLPSMPLDKHRALQILMNLISNAKHAMRESEQADKRLTLVVAAHKMNTGAPAVRFEVRDNGVGIASENLSKIFTLGFTTRESGHGYGLHTGATAAQEVGGSLSASSEGRECGASFTLVLPVSEGVAVDHDHDTATDTDRKLAA